MLENELGVSFLLCTYNGAPRLAETLACLAAQETPAGFPWEIIFVDNASTDGSVLLHDIPDVEQVQLQVSDELHRLASGDRRDDGS